MSSSFALILPAAGRSTRFGGARSKLLETLAGSAVVARSLQPFLEHPEMAKAFIPCTDEEALRDAIGPQASAKVEFCAGGESRAHSVFAALKRVLADIEWVAVHDAARPLISTALIEATWAAAKQYGAAVPALPAALTIKQATGPLPAKVERTLPRHMLWAMQTPQIMRRTDLLRAFDQCPIPLERVTDDVQLLELAGEEVWLIPGDEKNMKITTAIDLRVAEMWLGEPHAQFGKMSSQ